MRVGRLKTRYYLSKSRWGSTKGTGIYDGPVMTGAKADIDIEFPAPTGLTNDDKVAIQYDVAVGEGKKYFHEAFVYPRDGGFFISDVLTID